MFPAHLALLQIISAATDIIQPFKSSMMIFGKEKLGGSDQLCPQFPGKGNGNIIDPKRCGNRSARNPHYNGGKAKRMVERRLANIDALNFADRQNRQRSEEHTSELQSRENLV